MTVTVLDKLLHQQSCLSPVVHLFTGGVVCEYVLLALAPSRDDLKREAKRLRKELRSKDKEKEAKVEDSKEGMCFADILHSLG